MGLVPDAKKGGGQAATGKVLDFKVNFVALMPEFKLSEAIISNSVLSRNARCLLLSNSKICCLSSSVMVCEESIALRRNC